MKFEVGFSLFRSLARKQTVTFWHSIRSFASMKNLVTLLGCLTALALRADSPLTSTAIHKAYLHIAAVKNVSDKQVRIPGKEQLDFLDDTAVALDQKIALINAMGWGDSIRFDTYKEHISKKYGMATAILDSIITFRGPQPTVYAGTEKISAEDLCCMAYFRAMTDYFHPMTSYYCAYMAVDKKPTSMTASYVYGLILAQVYLNLDWCRLYQIMQDIKAFDGYSTDMLSAEALLNIHSYIDGYADACKPEDEKIVTEPIYVKPEKRQLKEKNKLVELSIIDVAEPYTDETNVNTIVTVHIMNSGNVASIPTNITISDLDITYAAAKKLGIKGEALKVIKDNNESAKADDPLVSNAAYLEPGVDYDQDFSVMKLLPAIQPGEVISVTFTIKGIWVYDSNCEMEIKVDVDDNIEEKDEKNNVMYFIKWG